MEKSEWKKGKHHRIYFNNVESVYNEKTGMFVNGEKADVFHYETGELLERESRKIQQQLQCGSFYYDVKTEKWVMTCNVEVEKVLKDIFQG